ncbi:Phat-5 [Aphelenchoides besseyi]|nr:Phat-5 [Aphelenchoides besseyi]KAI6209597.1 Phat-5 [Aphelenchoides besseyi]
MWLSYSIRSYSLTIFFVFPLLVIAQDGSSELLIEKPTITSGSSRLRVRCTDDNLRLYHNATACADEREPESCKMIFTISPSNSPAARDPKCDNPLLKDLADQCRNTCAICCEDPTYSCQNDDSGIVNCEQNVEKCGQPEFSSMMVKFCPATCGLCLTKRCRDQIEDCESMKSLCTNELYSVFMEHQCARTCGKCKSDEDEDEEEVSPDTIEEEEEEMPQRPRNTGTQVTSQNNRECVDLMKNCARNKKFCHHPSYADMMRKNCAKTCGYCRPNGGGSTTPTSSGKKQPLTRVVRECRDTHPFCKGWALNGYCESDFSEEEKREKCAKTCGLC